MWSANAFNLDQSKILSSRKELNNTHSIYFIQVDDSEIMLELIDVNVIV